MSETRRLLIIGSGPAGYTAAIYAARAGLNPLQVLGREPGGQLMITTDVENYPGFRSVIQGPWLMEEMKSQAENVGTTFIQDEVVEVDLSKRPFLSVLGNGGVIQSESLIIATGAQAKWLDIEGEKEFRGFGVSACATCDGFFFKNKRVAVIGGGNSAVEEALFLTNHAKHVTLIHRRDTLKAEKIIQNRLFKNPKISFIWNTTTERIIGEHNPNRVTGLDLFDRKKHEKFHLPIDGVFIAIGHTPKSDLFQGQLDLDANGYILTKSDSTETSIPGVYAAGDVQDKIFRQAITAAGQGCMAALEAEKFLNQ